MRRLLALALACVAAPLLADTDTTVVNPALVFTPLPTQTSETRRLQPFEVAPVVQRAGPGIAFGSPVGFGMAWGSLSVGGGIQEAPNDPRARFYGSNGLATGIGSTRTLALEMSVGINHFYELADSGAASFKLHRTFGGFTGLSAGVEQAARWGLASSGDPSVYVAVTRLVPITSGVLLSLNAGGRQRQNDERTTRAFGSVALLLNYRISFIADHTGRDLNAGVSLVPFDKFPLSLTVGMTNILEQDGFSRAVTGSAGLGLKFQ